MKVCLLLNRTEGGGAEVVGVRWATGLAERGHDVLVLTYDDPEPAAVPGTRTVGYPAAGRLRRMTQLSSWVRRETLAHGADAAIGIMTFANLVLFVGLRGSSVPVLLSEHNLPSNLREEGRGGRAKDRLAQGVYRRADAVLACSHGVAAGLSARYGVPTDRLWVVPNPAGGAPRRLPPAEAPRLLFVGRFAAQKRPSAFVDTVAELRLRGEQVTALAIGSGQLHEEVVERIRVTGAPVELAGWHSDWRTLARQGDVLVLPSLQEGFGNVLVEAADAGLASVAVSQALGVADAMIPGVTGVLAASGSVGHVADAVQQAWALPVPDPDLVQRWSQRFTADSAADVLERVVASMQR